VGGSNGPDEKNTTVGDGASDNDPTDVNNTNGESNQNSSENNKSNDDNQSPENEDDGQDSPKRVSLRVNAETVDGELINRGRFTLYSNNASGKTKAVAEYNLSEGPFKTFSNLTAGKRYTVRIDPGIFPVENFTVEAGQTERFTAEAGYKLSGADTYVHEYEIRSLGLDKNGSVYSDVVYIGKSIIDPDGDYYTTYLPKSDQGDPTVDNFDSLYVAELNASYRNLQGTDSEWNKIEGNYGPVTTPDQVVQNGLDSYNRTFVEAVQRDGETYHRYNTTVGTVEVNPESGYITYLDLDVSDDEELVYAEAWFHSHDSDDLEAIPDDFEPPSSEDE
jgi:hypothetical protein